MAKGLARRPADKAYPFLRSIAQKRVRPIQRGFRRNGFAVSRGVAPSCAETGTVRTSMARRNGYAFALHQAPLLLQKLVPISAEASAEMGTPIAKHAAWLRVFAETGTVCWPGPASRCRGDASCRASAHARRFGHHAHPARRPGTWPARFPSFDSHEQYFDRAALGRRKLANSSLAPWWACIGGATRKTAPAGDDTSQQEETT